MPLLRSNPRNLGTAPPFLGVQWWVCWAVAVLTLAGPSAAWEDTTEPVPYQASGRVADPLTALYGHQCMYGREMAAQADSSGDHYIAMVGADANTPFCGHVVDSTVFRRYNSDLTTVKWTWRTQGGRYTRSWNIMFDEPNGRVYLLLDQTVYAFRMSDGTKEYTLSSGDLPTYTSWLGRKYQNAVCGDRYLYYTGVHKLIQFDKNAQSLIQSVEPEAAGRVLRAIVCDKSDANVLWALTGPTSTGNEHLLQLYHDYTIVNTYTLWPWIHRQEHNSLNDDPRFVFGDGTPMLLMTMKQYGGEDYAIGLSKTDGSKKFQTTLNGLNTCQWESNNVVSTIDPGSGNAFIAGTTCMDVDGAGPAVYVGSSDVYVEMITPATGAALLIRSIGTTRDDRPIDIYVSAGKLFVVVLASQNFPTTFLGETMAQFDPGNTGNWGDTSQHFLTHVSMGSCSPGFYATGTPACTQCPQGKYTDIPDQLSCKLCPAGSESNSDATGCVQCQVGYYSATPGTPCVPCPTGYASNAVGASQCQVCLQGLFSSSLGSLECEKCPVGSYQPSQGQASCIECPLESTTEAEGSSIPSACDCGADQYGDPHGYAKKGVSSCQPCPANTVCARGTRVPLTVSGFWLEPSDPGTVYSCWPRSACPDKSNDCADGYTGTACDRCGKGYYRLNQTCAPCDYDQLPSWVLGVIAGLVVIVASALILCSLLAMITMLKFARVVKKLLRPIFIVKKIWTNIGAKFIRFAQLITIVFNLPISWPVSFKVVFGITGLFSFQLDNFVQTECLVGASTNTVDRKMQFFVLRLLVPHIALALSVLLVAALCLASCSCHHLRRRRGSVPACDAAGIDAGMPLAKQRTCSLGWFEDQVRSIQRISWMLVVFGFELLYVAVHSQVMLTFSCYEKAAGKYYMVVEPSVQCFTAQGYWMAAAVISAVSFVMFSLGVPAAFTVLLISTRPSARQRTAARARGQGFGAMYEAACQVATAMSSPYETPMYLWPVVQLLNRFFMAMAFPMTVLSTTDSLFCMFFTGLFFLVFHVAYWPFKRKIDDWLELSMRVSMVVLVISGVFFMTRANDDSGITPTGEYLLQGVTLLIMAQCMLSFGLYAASTVAQETGLAKSNRCCRWLTTQGADKHESAGGQLPQGVVVTVDLSPAPLSPQHPSPKASNDASPPGDAPTKAIHPFMETGQPQPQDASSQRAAEPGARPAASPGQRQRRRDGSVGSKPSRAQPGQRQPQDASPHRVASAERARRPAARPEQRQRPRDGSGDAGPPRAPPGRQHDTSRA